MSEFVCKKPITLSGRTFSYGEVIPDGFVLPGRALALIRSNYIAEIGGDVPVAELSETAIRPFQSENGSTPITIPIDAKEGILEVTTNSQTVISIFKTLQKKVEDAKKDIAEMNDLDALQILRVVDSRSGVQKAAEERAVQINTVQEVEETEKGDA